MFTIRDGPFYFIYLFIYFFFLGGGGLIKKTCTGKLDKGAATQAKGEVKVLAQTQDEKKSIRKNSPLP